MPWPDKWWRPNACPLRYAELYLLDSYTPQKEKPPTEGAEAKSSESLVPELPTPWCCVCMRPSFDPYTLPCGHTFCRRCVVETRSHVMAQLKTPVPDERAQMRCMVPGCRKLIPCLPIINGDLRFTRHRPLPPATRDEARKDISCWEQLQDYVLQIDEDMTLRRSDNLFSGFPDVVVIP